MNRFAINDLSNWIKRKNRKPLVLRGARQVGKSTLVRQLAQAEGLKLVELNLEKYQLKSLLQDGIDLVAIIQEIEVVCNQLIEPGVLLFLDEIQEQPKLLSVLRYFYEERSWLPVVAAGSLLEFALTHESVSIPVGRVEYYFLGPMKFAEFLEALGEKLLLDYLNNAPNSLLEAVHSRLIRRYKEYLFVGGMPEAVKEYVQTKSFVEVRRVQRSILQTYQDDFSKYAKHSQVSRIRRVFNFVPGHLGEKIKFSEIDREEKSRDLKAALELLIQARVIIPVFHTNASGVPLSAVADESVFKAYFLDVGLAGCIQGVSWDSFPADIAKESLTKGALAEQFVAQHLFYKKDGFNSSELYYWLRDKKRQNAEVDFIISKGEIILPVEVKSDVSGKMKSLTVFMADHRELPRALRLSLLPYGSELVEASVAGLKEPAVYELLSIPLYLIDRIYDLLG